MSSRFFATGDTESSSSEESDLDEVPIKTTTKRNYLLAVDSDDDDEKRVVKSKEQRIAEEIQSLTLLIRNKRRINDWSKVEEKYKELNKLVEKQKVALNLDNMQGRVYLRCIAEMDDDIKLAWPKRKDLARLVSKSLTNLKTQMKKFNQAKNLDSLMGKTRDLLESNPEMFEAENMADEEANEEEDDESSDESSDEESDEEKQPVTKSPPKKALLDDEDSDSDYWKTDDDDEDDESSDSDDDDKTASGFKRYTASYFLKKNKSDEVNQRAAKKARRDTRVLKQQEISALANDDEGEMTLVTSRRGRKPKEMFKKEEEVNVQSVGEKLVEILAQRGRRNTTRQSMLNNLRTLRGHAAKAKLGVGSDIRITLSIIASHFDLSKGIAGYMSTAEWHDCQEDLTGLLIALLDNKHAIVDSSVTEEDQSFEGDSIKISGDVTLFIERLGDEMTKHLQALDPHTNEYVERLKDDPVLYNIILLGMEYAKRLPDVGSLAHLRLLRIERLYYKRQHIVSPPRNYVYPEAEEGEEAIERPENRPTRVIINDEVESKLSELVASECKLLYGQEIPDRIRTRAMLCHVYHQALIDDWYHARDLMLMSHLQDHVGHFDIPTQILYNRTMVQLGLCAFRSGMITQAHTSLHDIWSGNRVKELLAQGVMNQRWQEKTQEETKLEKRRQTPFHMHINIEMLECVYYVCAMLIEIPEMSQSNNGKRQWVTSKSFRRQLDFFLRSTFNGPPENTRDHVMAGALAMKSGDWRKCEDLILNLKVWGLFTKPEEVKNMLRDKIKEESLRTYLFAYSGFYESLSLPTLSEMFELSEQRVHSIVSKMIISEELQASHDQPSRTIVIHKDEPTPLQSLALQFADKATQFVENNERLLDVRNKGGSGGNWGNNSSNYRGRNNNRRR